MEGSQAMLPAHGRDHMGAGQNAVRMYVTGFVLSILLTAVPFALVMSGVAPAAAAVPACIGLGVVQIVVHLVYFLHMDGSSDQAWNTAALIFTIIVVGILITGSLWVMYHLNVNMMPGMMPPE